MLDTFDRYTSSNSILEKYDDNLKAELKRRGVEDEKDINDILYNSHRGNLGNYLNEHGDALTFGLLNAIFKDSLEAKKAKSLQHGSVKATVRLIPIVLGSFVPIISILGSVFGSTRALDKIFMPLINEPTNKYPTFLKKMILNTVKIVEGDVTIKDRFSRAFVISDDIIKMLNENTVYNFSLYLSDKMSKEDNDKEVPDYYIETELRKYLNVTYKLNPPLSTKK